MKHSSPKPVCKLIAAWVCLSVYLLCTSGLLAWCGGVYSVLEGDHGVSLRVENQQWVVVLEHGPNAASPDVAPHHHDLMTDIITAFSINTAKETDHCLSGQKLSLVLDDQGTTIPLPATFCIDSNPTIDFSEPWAFESCNDVSRCLELTEPVQYTCFVQIPTVCLII